MATKKEPKAEQKIDYKDSSLHHDFAEIKQLLGVLVRDLDIVTKLIKIRSGVDV